MAYLIMLLRMRGSRTDNSRSVKIQSNNGRRQKEDNRTGQLLVVRPRQRFDKQRAGIGQCQDQRYDGKLVKTG